MPLPQTNVALSAALRVRDPLHAHSLRARDQHRAHQPLHRPHRWRRREDQPNG